MNELATSGDISALVQQKIKFTQAVFAAWEDLDSRNKSLDHCPNSRESISQHWLGTLDCIKWYNVILIWWRINLKTTIIFESMSRIMTCES